MKTLVAILGTLALFPAFALAQTALRLGHYGPTADPVHAGALKFKELVEQGTSGAVKVDLFPAEQLGKGAEMIQGVQVGSIDITITGNPFFSGLAPELGALDIPFLFRTPEHAYRVIDGQIGTELFGLLEPKGMKGLAFFEIGFRNLTNSVRPIAKPEDLKGLKLRSTPNPMHIEAFKTWGASAGPLAISEVYLALQTRTFDGQENPTVHIEKLKFHEVQKFMSVTRHAFTAAPMVMNLKKFQSLTAQQQAVLQSAALEAARTERRLNAELEAGSIAAIKKAGVQVNENVDIAPFRAAVYDKTRAMYTGRFGTAIVDKIDALK